MVETVDQGREALSDLPEKRIPLLNLDSGFGFWVGLDPGSGFRVPGAGFRVSGSGFQASVFGFWVPSCVGESNRGECH